MKNFLIIIGAIVGIFLLVFLINELEIFGMKFWGVRKANAQYEMQKNSQAYIDGKIQDLVRYHHEWVNADSTSKAGIESVIRLNFAEFDENIIKDKSPELYEFFKKIKYK